MLWGIPPETWLELWSGAIGAFVSAIGAAAVAWLVVRATNRHQSGLAKTALSAQREDAAETLRVQRELLEQQIREQRQESRRSEKVSALSEFIAGVREMSSVHDQTDMYFVGEIKRKLEAAAAKLDILGDDDEGLYRLLQPSISTLYILAAHRVADFQIDEESGVARHLYECTRAICELAPKWWNQAEGHDRRFIRSEINLTLGNAIEFLAKNLPFELQVTPPSD